MCELSLWHRFEARYAFAGAKGMDQGELRGLLTRDITQEILRDGCEAWAPESLEKSSHSLGAGSHSSLWAPPPPSRVEP